MAWNNPTGASSGSGWYDINNARDGSTGTFAKLDPPNAVGWKEYIYFTFSVDWVDKIQLYNTRKYTHFRDIQIDYYDGTWHNFISEAVTLGTWKEYVLPSTKSITGLRARYYQWQLGTGCEVYLHAIQYNNTDAPVSIPTVSTQSVTSIDETTATGNGNITDLGGEDCTTRGFCYMVGTSGDPTTADSTTYDTGSFGVGAYTKGLTGLTGGVNYRVRAYAINSAGTGYGTTVQMQTKKVLQETESFSAVDSKVTKITKAVSEAFTIIDSWVARLALSESFGVVDSLVKNATKQLSEAFSAVDSFVHTVILYLYETLQVKDSFKRFFKNLYDKVTKAIATYTKTGKDAATYTKVIKGLSNLVKVVKGLSTYVKKNKDSSDYDKRDKDKGEE